MRQALVLFFFVLIFSAGFCTALEERSFREMGYEDIAVEDISKEECLNLVFSKEQSLNLEKHYPIVSLHIKFSPAPSGDAKAKVFLNDLPIIAVLGPEEFIKDWARVVLPRNELMEKNELKVCLRTSEGITRMELLDDSLLGTYLSPDFSQQNSFVKEVITLHPRIGKELEVNVKLTNNGSKASSYKIQARNPRVERQELPILEGKTIEEGVIEAGQTIELAYAVKPSIDGRMVFPNAVAFVENAFGEEVVLESNYPEIMVYALEHKLKPMVLSAKGILEPGEQASVVLLVKNEGISPQFDVSTELLTEEGLSVEGKTSNLVAGINPNENKRFQFLVSASEEGTYEIGCSLLYLDQNIEEVGCEPIELVVRKETIEPQIIAGLVMLFVGLGIYLFIYFK